METIWLIADPMLDGVNPTVTTSPSSRSRTLAFCPALIPSRLTVSVSTRYWGCAYYPTSHDDSADASTELDMIVAIV